MFIGKFLPFNRYRFLNQDFLTRIGRTGRVGNTGRATSLWDWNTDGGIQRELVNILSDAKQPIPDWLAVGGGGRRY